VTESNQIPEPAGLDIKVNRLDRNAMVEVSGELDLYSSPDLERRLEELAAANVGRVVLDLAGVSFIDSTGLSVIISAVKRIRTIGGDLVLRSPSPNTVKLLEITGLDRVIQTES